MGRRSILKRPLLLGLDVIRAIQARYYARRLRRESFGQHSGGTARHGLPAELVVSLTSYPPRFETLDLTLRSLIEQDIRPDHLLLWVAQDDFEDLPRRVIDLEQFGLSIRTCPDIRSYKKLIPAVEAFPHAFIATADDDVYYSPSWLRTLVEAVVPDRHVVVARRTHRFSRRRDGTIAPYSTWEWDVTDAGARRPSTDLMPTGAGGILYPPDVLPPVALDRSLFTRLCPDGDDLWFFWTARMNGACHRQAGGRFWRINWPSSQKSSLWSVNEAGGNDRMIGALEKEFGLLELDPKDA
jgi:hypothetical protein